MTAPDPLANRSGLAFTLLAKAAEKRGSRLSLGHVCYAPETDMANGTSDMAIMPLVFRGAFSKNFPTLPAL